MIDRVNVAAIESRFHAGRERPRVRLTVRPSLRDESRTTVRAIVRAPDGDESFVLPGHGDIDKWSPHRVRLIILLRQ
jgi:hypothetical protein